METKDKKQTELIKDKKLTSSVAAADAMLEVLSILEKLDKDTRKRVLKAAYVFFDVRVPGDY